MFQNNETAAILLFQTNPVGVELFFSYADNFFYRIHSINRPERLLNFWYLESGRLFEVGAYSRLCAFHHSQQVYYVHFATKQAKM